VVVERAVGSCPPIQILRIWFPEPSPPRWGRAGGVALSDVTEHVEGYWLVLSYPENPTIRLDCRILDRILAVDDRLLLDADGTTIGLPLSGGARGAADVAAKLTPFTRSAPLTSDEAYVEAKRLLADNGVVPSHRLRLGNDWVSIDDVNVVAGAWSIAIQDVMHLSQNEENIQLGPYRIQAALIVLFIAATVARVENRVVLEQRVAEYEKRRGG
jgi:hypothetical protein